MAIALTILSSLTFLTVCYHCYYYTPVTDGGPERR